MFIPILLCNNINHLGNKDSLMPINILYTIDNSQNTQKIYTACKACSACIQIKHTENNIIHPDFYHIDANNFSDEDTMLYKNIIEKTQFIINNSYLSNQVSNIKVILIEYDEFIYDHHVNNMLLKSLEEPPQNCLYILTTTKISSVLDTIKSRCYKVAINDLSDSQENTILSLMYAALHQSTIDSNCTDKITDMLDKILASKIEQNTKDRATMLIAFLATPNIPIALEFSNSLDNKDSNSFKLIYDMLINWLLYVSYPKHYTQNNQDSIATIFEIYDNIILLKYNLDHPSINNKLQLKNVLINYCILI